MTGIILGLMLLTAPDVTTVALVSFVGLYWLIMGVSALVRLIVHQSVPWFWSLLTGLVGILAGMFVARHPLLAALTVPTAIVIVLGVQGLIMGPPEVIGGFMGRGVGSFTPGVIYWLAGLFLLGSPIARVLESPLVFGAPFLVQGVVLTVFAFRARARGDGAVFQHCTGSNQSRLWGSGDAAAATVRPRARTRPYCSTNLSPKSPTAAAQNHRTDRFTRIFAAAPRVQTNHLVSSTCIYAGVMKSPYCRL
jgi:uncharacterized membrane protein HdeD (DUF308 family)